MASTYGQMKVFWAKVFAQNERCLKAKRLTDFQINQKLRKAFPDKRSNSVTLVGKMHSVHRAAYNAGCFHDGKPPKRQSREYDNCGEIVVRRPGRKPKKKSKHGGSFDKWRARIARQQFVCES